VDLLGRLVTKDLEPTEDLKEYLTYVTEDDLEAKAWWSLVPAELQLQHSYSFYRLLLELEAG
jgi:hypothetical protein